MLAKFTIRRYVMACTVAVTVKIAIWLNPWVCKLWNMVLPINEWLQDGDSVDRAVGPIILPWLLTIVSIVAIYCAIYAFNKLTAWIFGEKK